MRIDQCQTPSVAHAHSHGPISDEDAELVVGETVRRNVWIAVAAFTVAAVIGLIALWPSGSSTNASGSAGLGTDAVGATVVDREEVPCEFDPLLACVVLQVVPSEGDLAGERLRLDLPIDSPVEDGDAIRVVVNVQPDGSTVVSFFDFQRSTPMLLLLLIFVAVIILFGGWRGLGALGGLAVSLGIIVMFALPALLDGSNAVLVALVTSAAIAIVALLLAHGFNVATAVALLSTMAALVLTGLLALLFVWTSKFTGFADESVGFLDVLGASIDPRGLLLAGILIGSLGVLDDVTVTQVSAVWELKRAVPSAGPKELYERGVRIGRDHISSTVNTLFLAYAGAALPLMLLFSQAGESLGAVATREVVAVEITRALVGSLGLVAAVPISTALAALVATADDPAADASPDDGAVTSSSA